MEQQLPQFKLSEEFLDDYKGKQPKWGPIGREVYERTYSRTKHNGEKETWDETIQRTIGGNLGLVPKKFIEVKEAEKLYKLFFDFKALPAGRHLWVSGVEGRQYLFNCHNGHFTDNILDHFYFVFLELMKGGGVGTNYSEKFVKSY